MTGSPMRRSPWIVLVVALIACKGADPREQHRRHLESASDKLKIEGARGLAKKAERDDVLLIARVARGSKQEVRTQLVEALGETPGDAAIDPLGEIAVTDTSDSVRAVATQLLLRRNEPKANAWLARAFQNGGPKTRASFATLDPVRLSGVIVADGAFRFSEALRRIEPPEGKPAVPTLRAGGLEALALLDLPDATTRVTASLSLPELELAAPAATAMARTHDRVFVPALEQALAATTERERGLVIALALAQLDPEKAGPLFDRLASVDDAALDVFVEPLARARALLTPTRSATVCTVLTQTENAWAVEDLVTLAGTCPVPTTRPARAAQHEARFRWARVVGACDASLVALALETVHGEPDGRRAREAARYVGRCGRVADATGLVEAARDELDAEAGVREIKEKLRELWAKQHAEEEAETRAAMTRLLGPDEAAKLDAVPSRLRARMETLLGARERRSELLANELRFGGHAFIAAALEAALRLGADVRPVLDRLQAANAGGTRGLAAVCLNALASAPATLDPEVKTAALTAVAALAEDKSSEARRMWLEAATLAGKAAPEKVLAIAAELDRSDRPGVAAMLGKLPGMVAPKASALVAAWAADESVSREELAPVLVALRPESAKSTLVGWMRSVEDGPAADVVSAVAAWPELPGDPVLMGALAGAALHPDGRARAVAVQALVPGCGGASVVKALAGDPDRRVKAAVAGWNASCAK